MDTTRIGIVALWCVVALLAVRKARRGGSSLWWACAVFALALASREQWEWNRALYQTGRSWLREQGWYQNRAVLKLLLGGAFAILVGWLVWRVGKRCRSLRGDLQLALWPMAAQALYFALLSFSVDAWIPRALVEQPGRTILSVSLGGLSLLGALWRMPRAEATRGGRA